MANRSDPDIDDDFSDLYKEYTGPPGSTTSTTLERAKLSKRSYAGSDEEEEPRDPNAVPTDFTSREAKFWEAKLKAYREDLEEKERRRNDLQTMWGIRAFHSAYRNSGARGRSSHSKFPRQAPYTGNLYKTYNGRNKKMGSYRDDGWNSQRRESDIQPGHQFDHNAFPQTLQEVELEYTRETAEPATVRDREEDEENFKHHEAIKDMREN